MFHSLVAVIASAATAAVPVAAISGGSVEADAVSGIQPPHLVKLSRESIPVRRKGKVVSYKSSYSGTIAMGHPLPQEFRVVFDTGSGHIIVPALQCEAEPCLKHRRFNASASQTSSPVNADGSPVDNSGFGDTATIGFGTGKVTGELIREHVCLGSPLGARSARNDRSGTAESETDLEVEAVPRLCTEVHTVAAIDMSPNPFSLFRFDGVVGLGLRALSLSANFSFFGQLVHSGQLPVPHFGFFMSRAGRDDFEEAGDEVAAGELAIGGHNAARRTGPLAWASVARLEQGFWQLRIDTVKIAGEQLDICGDGTCHGIVDTGTSHLGVPKSLYDQAEKLLSREARGGSDQEDCSLIDAPELQIGLQGISLTLRPEDYMRKIPLAEGTGLSRGITMPTATVSGLAAEASVAGAKAEDHQPDEARKWCRPKLTPVNMPAPLGPNLFILGEPVLRAFYTVFDWSETAPRIGFSPAAQEDRAVLV